MKIDIEDIKTISIAEDEHLLINVKDDRISNVEIAAFRKYLREAFGHNRVIIISCTDLDMTKVKYLDAVKKASVWRI